MTIQQLQYLLEVYRTGSISQTAKKLYVAQSSVSSTISALEHELGYEIFVRSRQGVHPTTQGLRILEQAGRICESYRLMTEDAQPHCTHIRIGSAAYAPISDAFCRLTMECIERQDVTLSHLTCSVSSVIDKLVAYELDLGIMLIYEPHLRTTEELLRSKNLKWTVRKTIPATLRLGVGHPLYHKEDLSLRDLESDILVDPPHGGTAYIEFLKDIMDINPDRVMLVGEQRTRYKLVSWGAAYSVGCKLPDYINEQYGFRNIPLEDARYKLVTVTNPARSMPPEIDRFLALLDEEMAQI